MVPWFKGDTIKEAKLEKRKLEKQWRKSKLEVDRQMFKTARNIFSHLIDVAKKSYYNEKINQCGSDQKKLFSVINDLMHHKDQPKLPSGSPSELVDSVSEYFVHKIENIRNKITNAVTDSEMSISPPDPPKPTSTLTEFKEVSEEEVRKLIMSSKSTSCPLDPLPTSLLKDSLSVLLPVITKLINGSLISGIVPQCFKNALIKPLLKKSTLDPEDLKNYRPISNLPFLSKVLEKVVANQLSIYMTENKLHENMQSAYKPGHSTESALLRVQNDILLDLDKKQGVILVLLDLSAAFDTIDHNVLLERLAERLGISGTAFLWFKDYLTGRTHAVYIDDKTSSLIIIIFGVPQGSVLGPVKFTIYTIPLGDIIKAHGLKYHLYADDTQVYMSFDARNEEDLSACIAKVQSCVCDIKIWMTRNMLKLNDEKTEVLFIASPFFRKHINVASFMVGQTDVKPAHSARNIGVVFDESMAMSSHVSSICKSSHYHLRSIGSIRKHISMEACIKLMHAFVTSRVDYCNSLLFGLPGIQKQRLQRILNTAARIVTLLPKHCHISPVLSSLHWLPIEQRIKFKILIFTFKAFHQTAPSYLCDIITHHQPSLNLRSSHNMTLDPYSHKTSNGYGEWAFSNCGPTLWNLLPIDVRKTVDYEAFKNKLKTHLFKEAFL